MCSNSAQLASGTAKCYVHCIGPYNRNEPGMGPQSPDEDSLYWVTGMLFAFGLMENNRGETVHATYLAASAVQFTPRVDTESPLEDHQPGESAC